MISIEKINLKNDKYIVIYNSVKGENKIENQDSIKIYHDNDKIICCIADGLGSMPFSNEGSKLIVNTGVNILKNEINDNFFISLRDTWKELVKNNYELYDTTFKFIRINEDNINIGSIGDGWIGLINNETYISETVDHEFANNTDTILTDRINDKKIIKNFSNNLDVAILATDGFSEDIEKDDSSFLKDISNDIENNVDDFINQVDYLMNNWPLKSNKDDKSVIIIKKL